MRYNYFKIGNNNSHIDTFFEMESTAGSKCHKDLILPDCTPGLMFIQRGDLSRNAEGGNSFLKTEAVYLFGQKTKAVEYEFQPTGLRAFGLKLKPSSIFTLFGIEASEITDTVIDVKEIIGPTDQHLELFYATAPTLAHKVKLILSCLKTNQPNRDLPLLEALLANIHHSKGEIAIQTLANKHNVGYKKMERLFKRHVGLTPKIYARIVRYYQCAVNGLRAENKRLTDIAYQGGFYDQMHFIKETKRLTGKIPSDLFKSQHPSLEPRHIAYLSQRGY